MIQANSLLAQRFFREGKLDDCPIYDFHGHMHELPEGYLPSSSAEEMAKTLYRSGTRSFVFCSHLTLFCGVPGETPNIEAVHQYPDLMKAYLGIRSYDLDFERDIAIYEQNPDVYVGFKFLADYLKTPLEHEKHRPYWEYADKHHLLCLCHTWGGSAMNGENNVRAIAEKYHNVSILCGHSFHGHWDAAIELANTYPNIYLELTAVLDNRGILERFCREVGSERILFGCDLPWFSTFNGIGSVLSADISDEDMRNIFYRNGQKLLGVKG